MTRRAEVRDIPRFCRMVTLSAFGSSTICMPKTSISSALARLKTSLKSRVCDPRTGCVSPALVKLKMLSPFSLMSCRLMGFRECSHDNAYRTRPLDNCSRLPLPVCCVASSMSMSSSSSGVSSRLLRGVCVGMGSSVCICISKVSFSHSNRTHHPSSRHCCCEL
jgi:hypothetical protein